MRFYEFAHQLREEADTASVDTLISVLNNLQFRMSKEGADTPVSKDTIINLVRNSGVPSFDESDLRQAWDNSLAVRNLIKEPNKDEESISFMKGEEYQPPDELGLDQPLDMPTPEMQGTLPPGMEMPIDQPGLVGQDTSVMPTTSGGPPEGPTGDRQTVSQMADRALRRRNK